MSHKHSVSVAAAVCGATLLFSFGGAVYGHDDDWSRTDKPLVWVDKKGKIIGRAVGGAINGGAGVQVRIGKLSLIVPVANRSADCAPAPGNACVVFLEVTWGGFAPLYWKDPDCRGQAYVGGLAPGSDRAVGIQGQTLYIGEGGPATVLTYQSSWFGGTCVNVPPPPFPPQSAPVWRSETTRALSTLGQPPLRLK